MKIDISNILKANGISLNVEFNDIVEGLDQIDDELVFNNPVDFKGIFVNIGGIIKMEGRIKTSYMAKCSRCLADFAKEIDIEVKEEFVPQEELKDDDVYYYQAKSIELDKVLRDNIILSLPAKQVCSEECKGFCPVCGANLNKESCNCKKEEIDPRMQALKDFFKE